MANTKALEIRLMKFEEPLDLLMSRLDLAEQVAELTRKLEHLELIVGSMVG